MRVYAALRYNHITDSTHLGEVFVDEQDAKKYKGQVMGDDYDVTVTIHPSELRTAWHG